MCQARSPSWGRWRHSSESGKSPVSRQACSSQSPRSASSPLLLLIFLVPPLKPDLPRDPLPVPLLSTHLDTRLHLSEFFLRWACGVTSEDCTPEGVLLPQTNKIKRDAPVLLPHLLSIIKLLGIYPRGLTTCAHRDPDTSVHSSTICGDYEVETTQLCISW